MSRSPRTNLRRALHSLEEAMRVMEEHPDARQEIATAVGTDGIQSLEVARRTLRHIMEQLDARDTGE